MENDPPTVSWKQGREQDSDVRGVMTSSGIKLSKSRKTKTTMERKKFSG